MSGARMLLAALLLAGLPGCVRGLIYTHVVRPLDLDLDATPTQPLTGESDWKSISINIVQLDWDTNALAEAARAGGITTMYYADEEVVSILFGIWQQRWAIVYGTGPKSTSTP